MGKEQLYKTITRLSSASAANSSPLTVDALEVPLNDGDIIFVETLSGKTYRTVVTSDVAVGATSIPINVKTSEATGIHNKTPIPKGAAIMIDDLQTQKYVRQRNDIYITCSSQAVASQYWKIFSSSGISNHSWNYQTVDTGTTVGTSTIRAIPMAQQAVGIVVPFDCVLVGFRATVFRVGNYQSAVGLFCGTPDYNAATNTQTKDFTLQAYAAADLSEGPGTNYSQRPVKCVDLTRKHSLSAGDIILPAFNSVTNNGGNLRVSYTIVLRYNPLD